MLLISKPANPDSGDKLLLVNSDGFIYIYILLYKLYVYCVCVCTYTMEHCICIHGFLFSIKCPYLSLYLSHMIVVFIGLCT